MGLVEQSRTKQIQVFGTGFVLKPNLEFRVSCCIFLFILKHGTSNDAWSWILLIWRSKENTSHSTIHYKMLWRLVIWLAPERGYTFFAGFIPLSRYEEDEIQRVKNLGGRLQYYIHVLLKCFPVIPDWSLWN